ncbi:hypothetical protein [Streptomyces shenzhenensis]|uniref:hypothetical protein n=1 Tax=Streptomyces shenzhenensis TaxID=943815 RepID=UPI0034042856
MQCSQGTGVPVLDALVGFFSFLGDPIGTIMTAIADFVLSAAITVFGALATAIPTLSNVQSSQKINQASQWLVVYMAVGSLIFAACRMAIERRGDAGRTALKGILRVVLVSGGATTLVSAAASLSDRYADYLFKAGAQEQLNHIGQCTDGGGIQAFLLMILAFLLLISGIIHTILLYIRLGVMILLLGTLPLAAAASMTEWGGGWWRKHVGWMIAWLLYKPAAALVMYGGVVMLNTDDPVSVNERIAGIGVMLLSAVSLPALLKLIVPATAALGGAGATSGAMSAAGGALASGARSLGGGLSGGGTSGRTGGAGPSGASGTTGGGSSGGASGRGGPAGAAGAAGSSGTNGTSGTSGTSGSGRTGPSGAGAGAGAGGAGSSSAAGGASRAAAAAGPVGAAVAAATTAAKIVGRTASGSLDGADGDRGHNS